MRGEKTDQIKYKSLTPKKHFLYIFMQLNKIRI